MAILFLILVILFALAASYYLYKNDFNSETLGVIFPAVGAILFSVYLGVKSIWIDVPIHVNSRTNIVLLQDSKNGKIDAMIWPVDMGSSELVFKFRGLKKIGEYQIYNAFKDMSEWKKLKKHDAEADDRVIINLIEYAIFDWFTQPYTSVGYVDRGAITMLGGAASQSGAVPVDLESVSVGLGENEWNPFIKAQDIKLRLPKGSKVKRNKIDGPFLKFSIETPHSTIDIHIFGRSGGTYSMSLDALGQKIRKTLLLHEYTPDLLMFGMPVEIETSQKAFSRYSDQAKLEAAWLKRIPEVFEEDFSWDKLRSFYASYTSALPPNLPPSMLGSK